MFASKREKKHRLTGIGKKMRKKLHKIKEEVYSPPPQKPHTFKAATFPRSSNRLSKLTKPDVTVSECSLSDTDTSSKFSVNSTNSLEAQAALYKRNNIFKGAYKGRVCEICEKKNDIFKCKECAGYFHATCVRKVAEDVEVPNNNKKKEKGPDVVDDSAHVQQEDKASVAECSSNMDDFSLQKRIDSRMKEIMQKFDYTSVYADSASDSEQLDEDCETENMKEVTIIMAFQIIM